MTFDIPVVRHDDELSESAVMLSSRSVKWKV
jgi:hypothetical protein